MTKSRRIPWLVFIGVGMLLPAACGRKPDTPPQEQQRPLLQHSIVGSSSCDTKPCYFEVMSRLPVQRFLLELAKGPAAQRAAEEMLGQSAGSIEDLLTLRLIRHDGERYVLNFALFTAADVRRVREVSARYAGSLVEALLARREELSTALRAYDAPGVDPKAVLYYLLGCASLDWDGLSLTAEKGYRKTTEERPDGSYVPAAEETGESSLEKIYWGSHSSGYDGVTFTSFGDLHSLPRFMLPDILWRTPDLPSSYPDTLRAALRGVFAESLERGGDRMGRMMAALREGPRSAAELALAAGAGENEAGALLSVLIALDYIAEEGGQYRARVPVLTKRDEPMASRIRAIGRQAMDEWLAANYEGLRGDLEDLTFLRSGVPFSEGFTMIWHFVFGIANRNLVEAGLFADPYEEARRFKGAIPAVSALDLN